MGPASGRRGDVPGPPGNLDNVIDQAKQALSPFEVERPETLRRPAG